MFLLTKAQVLDARNTHGYNRLEYKNENGFFIGVKSLVKDPMVILLLAASSIHFISGNIENGVFLALAILVVSFI